MGCDPQHVDVGNHGLYQLFTGGKRTGNPTLYLATLYWLIHHAKEFEYLRTQSSFMEQLHKHLEYRLSTTKSNLALTSEPGYPLVFVPVKLALYYCMHSHLFLPTDSKRYESLRQHAGYYNVFTFLLRRFNLITEEDETKIMKRARLCQVIGRLHHTRAQMNETKFKNLVRLLYQDSLSVQNEGENILIPLDGCTNPSENYSKICKVLIGNLHENDDVEYLARLIVYLSTRLTNNGTDMLKISDIDIPENDLPSLSKYKSIFPSEYYTNHITVKICIKTLRPWILDPTTKLPFEESCLSKFKVNHRMVPLYNYMCDYIVSHRNIPNSKSFMVYAWNRMQNRQDSMSTVPLNFELLCDDVVKEYTSAFEIYKNLDDMINIINKSRPRETRAEMENN